jgi:putative FmdB family regulatory protein
MPIYEFQCEKCSQITEAMLKFSDAPLTVCPHCGGHMDKLISMNSFQLKGGGWYVTDYAKKSDACAAKSGQGAKAEAKPAECAACKSGENTGCPAKSES